MSGAVAARQRRVKNPGEGMVALRLVEVLDGFIQSRVIKCPGDECLTFYIMRIDARQGLIDIERSMRQDTLPQHVGRQRICMILTNTRKGRLCLKKFL